MKKNIFNFIVISITLNLNVASQTVEPSTSIDKSKLQIELESMYTIQKEEPEKIESWSIPSILFRYGFINGVELQFNIPIIKEQLYENDHLIHSLHKFDDAQIGFSFNLWEQQKILPEAAFMVRAIIPVHKNLKFNELGKVLSLNLSNKLSDSFSLNYNVGYVVETNNTSTGFYIANLNYELNSKFHVFIENFGDFTDKEFISQNINTGIGYHINSNFCIDLSLANGLNHHMFFVGGILTWVLNTN